MTDEQKAEVEKLAGLFFTTAEIALITDLDPNTSAFSVAVQTGRLRGEAEVRTSVFEHAKSGSSPAQALAVQFIRDLRIEEARK